MSRLLADALVTASLHNNHHLTHALCEQLVTELLDGGVLLLLIKSARHVPTSNAVLTKLQIYFDDYTTEYIIAAQSMLVLQQVRNCRSLLDAGMRATARQNVSTAALLAWAHTRSSHWAAASCSALPEAPSILFPCASHSVHPPPPSEDPCLERYITYYQCIAQAQSIMRLSADDASTKCQHTEAAARRCDYAHDGYCGWDGGSSLPLPVIRRARTLMGPVLYHAYDLYFRISLELYGEWAYGEVEFMLRFLPPGATVVDAGAHVGTVALALARKLGPSSTVIAIEASRFFASLARANAAAGGLSHMHVVHAALGNSSGCFMAPLELPYSKIGNFGGRSLISCPERVQRACAERNCALHGETYFDGSGVYEWWVSANMFHIANQSLTCCFALVLCNSRTAQGSFHDNRRLGTAEVRRVENRRGGHGGSGGRWRSSHHSRF